MIQYSSVRRVMSSKNLVCQRCGIIVGRGQGSRSGGVCVLVAAQLRELHVTDHETFDSSQLTSGRGLLIEAYFSIIGRYVTCKSTICYHSTSDQPASPIRNFGPWDRNILIRLFGLSFHDGCCLLA